MKQKLTDNIGLKILALAVSVILWFIAININDPVTQDSYNVTVQLQNLNTLTSAGKYVEVLDGSDSVKVTVRGSRTVLSSFSEKNIVAIADVSKITEDNLVPIEVTTTRITDKIETIRPDKQYVQLAVENISKQQIPINVKVQNEPGEGYIFGSATTTQNVVILSGPESVVSKVAYAAVEINIDGATSDVNISLPIHLYDKNDDLLDTSKITMSMNEVYTTASILQTKQLNVVCGATGTLPDGYALTGVIDCVPDTVTVAGRSSQVKNLTTIEIPEALDVSGRDTDVTNTIDIREYIPDGVSLVGGSDAATIEVTARVEKETTKEYKVAYEHIHTTGVPEGLDAYIDEEDDYLYIEIQGLKRVLADVDEDAIVGIVDVDKYMKNEKLEELTSGIYIMPVSFTLPDGTKVSREYRVRVKVRGTE